MRDNPNLEQPHASKVIEFPSGHSLECIPSSPSRYVRYQGELHARVCEHNALELDERRGLVICEHCADEMSPLEALKTFARHIWWEENAREREMEHQIKRVSKVQKAALEYLFRAGITPEKYAEKLAAWRESASE
jgi:hypothetical protein